MTSFARYAWSEYYTVRNIIYSCICLFIKNASHYTYFNNQYCVNVFLYISVYTNCGWRDETYLIWSLIKCLLNEVLIINVKRKDALFLSPLPSSCQACITMVLNNLVCDRENKWGTKSISVRNRKSNFSDIVNNMQSS